MVETVSREELKEKIDRGDTFALVETLKEVAYKHEQPARRDQPPARPRA